MKTLKKLTLAILAAGSLAACSSTRTGTGSGGASGTRGTGTDSASTGTTRDSSTSNSGTSGSGGNTTGSINSGSSVGNYAGNTEVSGTNTNSTVNPSGSVTSTSSANGIKEGATGISGTQGTGAGNPTSLSGTGSSTISGGGALTASGNSNGTGITSGKSNVTTIYGDSSSASAFISKAHMSGMKEIELSRLAQTKASKSEVRSFAMMMIKDHSMQHQQLSALARTKGVSLTEGMTGMGAGPHMGAMSGMGKAGDGNPKRTDSASVTGNQDLGNGQMMDNSHPSMGTMKNSSYSEDLSSLKNLSGAEFDREYMQMMIKDHEQAIALFSSASHSTDAQIKAYAVKNLPKLRAHLRDAREISNKLK